jgi:hypothetical protein
MSIPGDFYATAGLASAAPGLVRRGGVVTFDLAVSRSGGLAPRTRLAIATKNLVAPAATLPSNCFAGAAAGVTYCNITSPVQQFRIGFLFPLTSPALSVNVSTHIEVPAGGGAFFVVPNVASRSSNVLATVFAAAHAASGSARSVAQHLVVAGVSPPLNQFAYGGAFTVTGAHLDLLPCRLFVGPLVVNVTVAADAATATFTVPAAPALRAMDGTTAVQRVAALTPNDNDKLFAHAALTATSAAAITAVRSGLASGAAYPIARFGIVLASAEVFVFAAMPSPLPPTPLPRTDKDAPTTSLPVFVPGSGPPSNKSTSTATAGGENCTSTGIQQVQNVTDSSGAVIGHWVYFTFNCTFECAATLAATAVTPCTETNVTVTVTDPDGHTVTTYTHTYTHATYQLAVARTTAHAVRVTLTHHSGGAVARLRALAFTDSISGVPFSAKSRDAACANDARNASVGCARASLAPAARRLADAQQWQFDLYVATPGYFRRDVVVALHVVTKNSLWMDVSLLLTRDPASTKPVLHTPGTTPGGAGLTPDAGASAGTPQPAATVPAADETVSSQAALSAVFSLDGGCRTPKFPVLPAIVVAFLVLLAIRIAHYVARRKQPVDVIATVDVSPLRGLLAQHAWLGAIAPCHRYCGPLHAVLLLVHVLIVVVVCAALLSAWSALASTSDALVLCAFALVGCTAAAAARPVVGALFDMYGIVDARVQQHIARDWRNDYNDLVDHGVHLGGTGVGVSCGTFTDIVAIDFVTEAELLEEQRRVARAIAAAGGRDVVSGALLNLAPTAADRAGNPDLVLRNAAGCDPSTGVTVVTGNYPAAGFAFCGAGAVGLVVAIFSIIGPWCGTRVAVFERTLVVAVLLDVCLAQPLFVLAVWLWRWVASEEEDGRAVHNCHPIDGQWRVIGPIDYDGPAVADVAACASDDGSEHVTSPPATATSDNAADADAPCNADDAADNAADADAPCNADDAADNAADADAPCNADDDVSDDAKSQEDTTARPSQGLHHVEERGGDIAC